MAEIELKRVGRVMARIPVEGTAPLIVNKFSAKAMQIMLDKQMGEAVQREPKNPEQLFRDSLHVLPPADGQDRYGFPATGFKAAMVNAARYFKGSKITMELLKQAIYVRGEGSGMLVPLLDGTAPAVPKMRQDNVRNASGVADIRFRGEFWPWSATLEVVYVSGLLSLGSIVALADAAGLGGVGEWRPASKESKTGVYGTWHVPDSADINEITL
jgi:hypothetical protein